MRKATVEGLRVRLADDHAFYAANCLQIVAEDGHVVPFVYRPPQVELARKLEAQREAGQPMRALICKARKLGFSTMGQGMLMQRATTRAHHVALCVAHDMKTSGELFKMAEVMHSNLPDDPELGVKPHVRNQLRGRELVFGESSITARRQGQLGLNSSYSVQTAKEQEAGRGFTVHSLWLSEAAFYPEGRRKFIALLNAVPDDPDTLIVQESTGNGFNHFRDSFVHALEGSSDYIAYFSPWMDDHKYSRPFIDSEARHEFVAQIGEGEWGEEEPDLVQAGVTPEQLHWRRWCIENKTGHDLRTFWQEYPSNWQQAFLASGQGVFSPVLVDKVLKQTDETDRQAIKGTIGVTKSATRRLTYATVDVAREVEWVPREQQQSYGPQWKVWEHPLRPETLPDTDPRKWVDPREDDPMLAPTGRYVVALDPMSGELTEEGDLAYHAICVIDHRTRLQVAEYQSRIDPDLIALELHKAALYYCSAWVAIEITGGYGLSIKNKLGRDFRYPYLYRRRPRETRLDPQKDLVGWDTNIATIVELRDTVRELLRTMPEVFRSRTLALELSTYRQDERGRMGPETGKYADCYMAFAIAQQVAKETPIRPERESMGAVSTTGGKVLVSRRAGY